jgi:hypothetical protein
MGQQRFIGGLRVFPDGTMTPSLWRGMNSNASRPLAELLIDDDERRVLLRLRWPWLRRLSRLFAAFPQKVAFEWEAPLESVSAEPFGGWSMTRGVLLRASGRPPAIFWCSLRTQRAVLALPLTQQTT